MGLEDKREPREWWIDPTPCDEDMPNTFDAFLEHPRQGPLQWQTSLTHVIEFSAYESMRARAEEAEAEWRGIAQDRNIEVSALKQDILDIQVDAMDIFCCVAQIMSGWQHDESWSDFDEETLQRIYKFQSKIDLQKGTRIERDELRAKLKAAEAENQRLKRQIDDINSKISQDNSV